MRKKIADLIERGLEHKQNGGIPCQTCALPNIKAVNADLRPYCEARIANGKRGASWNAIHAVLVEDHGYPFGVHTMVNHCRRAGGGCLGYSEA